MSRPTALIAGGGLAGARAALEVAEAGAWVTLLTPDEGLNPGADGPLGVPTLLDVARHPRISLLPGAVVDAVENHGASLRVMLRQTPRYVNPARCTACAACAEVCPVLLQGVNGAAHTSESATTGLSHKAIYRGGVPTTFVIDKAGTSPCRDACPIHQRAQGYVALIGVGDYAAAYDTIKRDNPFPSICGRVCNHRCEESCSRGKADAPVNIMGLKRFVADWARERAADVDGREMLDKGRATRKPEPTGKKVAVVGAGPAGLTCALDTVRNGHAVTVYEALPVAGGMMRVGVPEYRLPHDLVQNEIDDILAQGVDLVLNHSVEDVPALLRNGFDAVFVAVGAHEGVRLPIPGADLPEVLEATGFLRAASLRNGDPRFGEGAPNSQIRDSIAGKRILVLGGGNVAVDAAMTAVRLEASWIGMACLESREEMPAHDWEVRDAEEEGIELLPSRTFKEITDTAGHVSGVRCAQIDFRGFKAGRPDFDELLGTEHLIPADVVIFAIGQRPRIDCLRDQVDTIRGRAPVVDPDTLATSLAGVFAGGDVVTGTAFIVDAIAAGHQAARSIDRYLRGLELTPDANAARLPPVELDEAEVQRRLVTGQAATGGRIEGRKRPAQERRQDFDEIYSGLTEAEAQAEAARCLSCGGCSECLQCEEICPAGAISHDRGPRTWEWPVGAVIWANDASPSCTLATPSLAGLSGVFVPGNDLSMKDAVDQTLSFLGVFRPTRFQEIAAPSQWQPIPLAVALPRGDGLHVAGNAPPVTHSAGPRGPRARDLQLGVILCRCGGEIERAVDLSAVAARVEGFPSVTFVGQVDFACHPEGSEAIRSIWAAHDLDRAVLAACSCCALDQICYSCTTQRTRCKDRLGVWDGLAGLSLRFVNVREQCAFVHRDNPDAATLKAGDLVAASVGALSLASAESRIPSGLTVGTEVARHAFRLPVTASIDLVRCRGCEDCESVCGLQAVEVIGNNGARAAQVDPRRCLGCGVCMAVCSSGAILAGDMSDAQVEARLSAMGDLSDKTLVFCCNWGAYSAVEAAGVQRLDYDPSIRLVRLMCSGRAHIGVILQAFAQGADRVLVLTCGHGDDDSASQCRYHTGNDQAGRSVEQAQRLISLLGIDAARLALYELRPGDGAGFVAAVKEFLAMQDRAAVEGQ